MVKQRKAGGVPVRFGPAVREHNTYFFLSFRLGHRLFSGSPAGFPLGGCSEALFPSPLVEIDLANDLAYTAENEGA